MICQRCGMPEDSVRMKKRLDRGMDLLCRSCSAAPAKTIKGEFGKCVPHHGSFTPEDEPLDDDGNLFLPGERVCGNRDCVARDHVESDE